MSPDWAGVFCALWTPTDAQGEILPGALANDIARLERAQIAGLLVLGSTGEFLHLEPVQRRQLILSARQQGQALKIIVNVSDVRPRIAWDLARYAREVGCEAVSVLPPYFFPVAQEDLVEFFVRTGEAAQLPLFLYNFPERTGNRIDPETVAAVADRVPLAGVKQSGGEFSYHRVLAELGRKKGFVVLTGADTRLPEALAEGVIGCVSGLSNAVPELVVQALADAQKGIPLAGQTAAWRLTELSRRLAPLAFPLDVRAAMAARGLEVGEPKSVLSRETRNRWQAIVEDVQVLFREWKLT